MKARERGEVMSFCEMMESTQNATLTENNDCSLNTFALLIVCGSSLAIGVLNIVLSTVINYVGRKRMVIAIQVIAGLAGLCVNATNSWILGTGCLIVYISANVNFGFISTFSVDIFPTYVKNEFKTFYVFTYDNPIEDERPTDQLKNQDSHDFSLHVMLWQAIPIRLYLSFSN
ncbi:jg2098 [Pararge aegeria aegeria]|uniref:Jg2098 protein n=1 Tax=Pararge aegeria aegeria TaxID=348720 RepID=A0A8S4R128_9NEOP|nr:jg2098 [Pararge aegeria aegeria]